MKNEKYFPITELLDVLAEVFEDFSYEIVEDDELPLGTHADADVLTGHIRIKQSVYNNACNGNGREGYEKLYRYKNQYYLLTGVGTNGFIVTSYPIDSASARKLKERYGK